MNQPKAVLLLHADQVLCTNRVPHPKLVVVVFTVPPPELRREVVDVIESVVVEEAGHLHETRDIAADVIVSVIVLKPRDLNGVSTGTQRANEYFSHRSESTCD